MLSDAELMQQFGLERRRKVVLVVDLVESVSLMQQDELGVIQRWQAFLTHVNREVLPAHQGRLVKSLGDGLMVEFEEARDAVGAAWDMHAWMDGAEPLRTGSQLRLRGGVHTAQFLSDRHDIYGSDVNLAARVASLANPGQILVTSQLHERLVDGLDAHVRDLGERYVKHLADPIRVFEVSSLEGTPTQPAPPDRALDKPVVVVFPFGSRNVADQEARIGDLIADVVIHQLSRMDLVVLSRLSSASIWGRNLAPSDIQQRLGARYALSGHFYALDEGLIVGVELVDLETGALLWTDRRKGDLRDLLSPASELAAWISSGAFNAVVRQSASHAASQPPSSLEDYSLLLGGITLMHRQSRPDFMRAQQLLVHLTERRPRFGTPRAWLGQWYAIGVAQGWLTDVSREAQRAMAEVDCALDQDPSLSLAMTIKGQVASYLLKDFEAAEKAYRAALTENPNESLAWLFTAVLHAWRGEGASARDAASRALVLSPMHPARYFYESLAATAYLAAGDFAASRQLAERSMRAHCLHTSTHKTLIVASTMDGDLTRARAVTSALLALEPSFTVSGFLARSPMANSPMACEIAHSMRAAGVPDQ